MGQATSHLGGNNLPSQVQASVPPTHPRASAPVDPPQPGGLTVQAALEFLEFRGFNIDPSEASASDDQDTQDYRTRLGESKDSAEDISFSALLTDLDTRFPGCLAAGPQSNKPASMGLDLLGESKDSSSKSRLPMAASLDTWFKYHNSVLTGEALPGSRQKVKKAPSKDLPQTPVSLGQIYFVRGDGTLY